MACDRRHSLTLRSSHLKTLSSANVSLHPGRMSSRFLPSLGWKNSVSTASVVEKGRRVYKGSSCVRGAEEKGQHGWVGKVRGRAGSVPRSPGTTRNFSAGTPALANTLRPQWLGTHTSSTASSGVWRGQKRVTVNSSGRYIGAMGKGDSSGDKSKKRKTRRWREPAIHCEGTVVVSNMARPMV